jgi:hypothetical protein
MYIYEVYKDLLYISLPSLMASAMSDDKTSSNFNLCSFMVPKVVVAFHLAYGMVVVEVLII